MCWGVGEVRKERQAGKLGCGGGKQRSGVAT